MSLYKSLVFIFQINIHQLRWYQSLCTVFCLSSKMIWSSDSISVWLHAMKKSHCLHQLKVRKLENHFTLFLFPPKKEQKPFPESALKARAGLEKDFYPIFFFFLEHLRTSQFYSEFFWPLLGLPLLSPLLLGRDVQAVWAVDGLHYFFYFGKFVKSLNSELHVTISRYFSPFLGLIYFLAVMFRLPELWTSSTKKKLSQIIDDLVGFTCNSK